MPAGVEKTPLDSLTGLPLPLMMSWADFYLEKVRVRPNDYHHGFHPKKSLGLGYGEGGDRLRRGSIGRLSGDAVRFSRGQNVPSWIHARYHDIFYGPELPISERDKFAAVVLACAGVVPRQAIDLYTPGEFRLQSLNDKQHDFIRRRTYFENATSLTKTGQRNRIGRFLAEYILDNTIDELITEKSLKPSIDSFLRPTSEVAWSRSARDILAAGMEVSLLPLIPIYKEAEAEGMVRDSHRSLGKTVLRFFSLERFPDYFDALEGRLVIAQG